MKRSSLFWGAVLILAGFAWLLESAGWIHNAWNFIWAGFLIALGVRILWGRTYRRNTTAGEKVFVPLEGATRVRLRIQHGAGRLEIRSGAEMLNFVDGVCGGGLEMDKNRNGDQLDVKMSLPSESFPFFWEPGNLDWALNLSCEPVIELEINTGASDTRLDLSDLRISELRLHTGASASDVRLPANAGLTKVWIESGVASATVHVPEGVAARVRSHSGLAAITVNTARFPHSSDCYQSPDFDTATNKVEIDIQTGVSAVDVR